MLKIEGLQKTYYDRRSSKPVLHDLSLEVKKGSIFGLLGANGAGKTTAVKVIVDLLFADSGSITINSQPHTSIEAKKAIGFMPEQPQFYYHLSAQEVMEYVGELFSLPLTTVSSRAKSLLSRVGLSAHSNLPVRKFSKGMHQRLAFAVALMNDPKLLILDEPLDGLDPLGRLDFKQLLLEQKKKGKTVFFSSHILSDVEEICDEVAVIDDGRVISQGVPAKLRRGFPSLEEYFVATVTKQ